MTNEKVIKIIDSAMTTYGEDAIDYDEVFEAKDIAIKALETVSCIKEKCAYCPHCENCDVDDETLEIKALEQQPCEDWYDVSSDEMTLEQARQAVKDLRKKLSEYLEQEPCEDAISRKDMLAVLRQSHSLTQVWDGFKKLPSVTPKEKTGNCKDCKWWKDNDGVYRRGVRAESKCPINRKEVYEGNGYCFLFEPQESEDKEVEK